MKVVGFLDRIYLSTADSIYQLKLQRMILASIVNKSTKLPSPRVWADDLRKHRFIASERTVYLNRVMRLASAGRIAWIARIIVENVSFQS
jgi:hypothetical protein